MKFEIKNRWTGSIIFECEAVNLRAAVEKALEHRVSLSAANLSAANLSAADLSAADLRDANLSAADLSAADLSAADLRDANLSAANLSAANLSAANLSAARNSPFKNDLFELLLHAPREVPGLLVALREGRVNGSVYEGDCACLVGTIANLRGCTYLEIPGLKPDYTRPAEQWFLGIREGDTPETNPIVALTLQWIEEFQGLLAAAIREDRP